MKVDGSNLELLWVGGVGGMEADLVERAGIPFAAIPAAGVHGVGIRSLPGNLLQLLRGILASRRVLGAFEPEVLLFTGGYVAVPMGLAARLPRPGPKKPRSLLYIPDIEPGWALKVLARFADHIAITTEATRAYLPARVPATVTGYPIRLELAVWESGRARQSLGLETDLPVLLVSGGSRGARSINRALLEALPVLLEEMQVVHISGRLDWEAVENAWRTQAAQLPDRLACRYHPYPYLHEEMGAAMSAADLALSRAGASSLGEYPHYGLPAVLVPYPYAWRYQRVNAMHLVEHGAAVLLEDADLILRFLPLVSELMRDQARLQHMREAMLSLAQPQAAEDIALILKRLGSLRN
jgi:UDP-N-acetylglucosamine--N-acetylmuramyl-(pentapeptide) pyrophosphoryl-undecaprenol N-acetylglucosamine transferase